MKKYKIEQPLPQFGKDVARVIEVPYEVVEEIRADAFDEFADHIKTHYASKKQMGYAATTYEFLIFYIDELLERLKAGGKNEID